MTKIQIQNNSNSFIRNANKTIIIEITYYKRSSHCDVTRLPCKEQADDEWPTQTKVKTRNDKIIFFLYVTIM